MEYVYIIGYTSEHFIYIKTYLLTVAHTHLRLLYVEIHDSSEH